jgi:hypothetical protein
MIPIHTFRERLSGLGRTGQRDPDALGANRLARKRMVRQQNHDFTVFDTVAYDPGINRVMEAIDEQSLVAEAVRELERPGTSVWECHEAS